MRASIALAFEAKGRLSVFPYSGITCMVDVPGTGPGIGTVAGAPP
jgi:hypothetical protein